MLEHYYVYGVTWHILCKQMKYELVTTFMTKSMDRLHQYGCPQFIQRIKWKFLSGHNL